VDSQNVFEAMILARFNCVVRYTGDDRRIAESCGLPVVRANSHSLFAA
jgi:hypothetical protein